ENATVALLRAMGPKALQLPDDRLAQLWRALGIPPVPAAGEYFVSPEKFIAENDLGEEGRDDSLMQKLDDFRGRPWGPADSPGLAKWITSQDAAIERIAAASRLPRSYLPLVADPGAPVVQALQNLSGLN